MRKGKESQVIWQLTEYIFFDKINSIEGWLLQ